LASSMRLSHKLLNRRTPLNTSFRFAMAKHLDSAVQPGHQSFAHSVRRRLRHLDFLTCCSLFNKLNITELAGHSANLSVRQPEGSQSSRFNRSEATGKPLTAPAFHQAEPAGQTCGLLHMASAEGRLN
jgi:hypothetical protein